MGIFAHPRTGKSLWDRLLGVSCFVACLGTSCFVAGLGASGNVTCMEARGMAVSCPITGEHISGHGSVHRRMTNLEKGFGEV